MSSTIIPSPGPRDTQKKADTMSVLGDWTHLVCDWTSIHGLVWYTRLNSRVVKGVCFILALVAIIGLPTFLGLKLVEFACSDDVLSRVTFGRTDNMSYPNVTICHPRFFQKAKMQELGMNPVLGDYVSTIFTVGVAKLDEANVTEAAVFKQREAELSGVLAANNMSISQLFQAIAIPCQSIIFKCDVGGKTIDSQTCCDRFFFEVPTFTFAGTCFSTKATDTQVVPMAVRSIKFWLHLGMDEATEITEYYHGLGAYLRTGLTFSISTYPDHPVTSVYYSPNRIQESKGVTVGMTMQAVDRTRLSPSRCSDGKNATFEDKFGFPYSQTNCDLFNLDDIYNVCSFLEYWGLKKRGGMPGCTPLLLANNSVSSTRKIHLPHCLPDCFHKSYKLSESVSDLNGGVKDYAMLQVYIRSFNFDTKVEYQEDYTDFLSKIGGWIGLIVGASLISFIEFLYFVCLLFKRCVLREKSI